MHSNSNSGSKYFAKNFQNSDVSFGDLKEELYKRFAAFSGNNPKEIARQIKEYCQENEIKLKINKQGSSGTPRYTSDDDNMTTRSRYSTRRTSGNVNITINENKGLSFLDYLLLQSLFSNKPQPIIINNAPTATYSAPPQQKKDKSKEGSANVLIFLAALCVITHLAVCAVYHLYFKKEAEKSDKSIDYLVNRQLGIAIFQLAFGVASLVTGGAFLSQSEIFFPLLINTFICLGSAYLFYRERNSTLKTEVEPYMKLAKLLIDDERRENQRTRSFTYSTGHPSAPHNEQSQSYDNQGFGYNDAPPPYSPHPSAPSAYENQSGYGTDPDLSSQFSNPNVTERQQFRNFNK